MLFCIEYFPLFGVVMCAVNCLRVVWSCVELCRVVWSCVEFY